MARGSASRFLQGCEAVIASPSLQGTAPADSGRQASTRNAMASTSDAIKAGVSNTSTTWRISICCGCRGIAPANSCRQASTRNTISSTREAMASTSGAIETSTSNTWRLRICSGRRDWAQLADVSKCRDARHVAVGTRRISRHQLSEQCCQGLDAQSGSAPVNSGRSASTRNARKGSTRNARKASTRNAIKKSTGNTLHYIELWDAG
mmetsp:Transcript_71810/g.124674  ORF Transcript_71810/g.124674 Transcript_71810/m.124674 type:complete len:207 (+) Transcript_71810:920-1540(+)